MKFVVKVKENITDEILAAMKKDIDNANREYRRKFDKPRFRILKPILSKFDAGEIYRGIEMVDRNTIEIEISDILPKTFFKIVKKKIKKIVEKDYGLSVVSIEEIY